MSKTPSRIVADPSGGEFHDQRFPPEISLGAVGGPERKTDVVLLASGHERRNAARRRSRRRYNAGYGIKSLDDIEAAVAFFEARRGRLHAFRWKDHPRLPIRALRKTSQPRRPSRATTRRPRTISARQNLQPRLRSIPTTHPTTRRRNDPSLGQRKRKNRRIRRPTRRRSHYISRQAAETPITSSPPDSNSTSPVRFDADSISAALTSRAAGEIPDIPIIEVADLENR